MATRGTTREATLARPSPANLCSRPSLGGGFRRRFWTLASEASDDEVSGGDGESPETPACVVRFQSPTLGDFLRVAEELGDLSRPRGGQRSRLAVEALASRQVGWSTLVHLAAGGVCVVNMTTAGAIGAALH
jgi:hypothetical protein